ncbi:MAG: protein kinase domain-containing protein [Terriglobales bacterium]
MPTAVVAACPQCGEAVAAGGATCTACGSAVDWRGDKTPALPPGAALAPDSDSTPTLPPSTSGWPQAASASERSAGIPVPGQDFGPRYRIERLLGEGGMGRVYLAYDRDLDRRVALKIILPALAADAEMMRRFKQELLLASRVSQKNVLRIHDLGEAAGVKFISMAYIEGEDLARRLRREKKLPPEEASRIGAEILAALAAAHEQGVVHRDLKPQNLLLDHAGTVYVTDFGLAKSADAGQALLTQAGAVLGTPRYMSPEQVEGKPVDARGDLYSFGLILYEMATGATPFPGTSALELMYQRLKTQPRDPASLDPKLPVHLRRVILRCLATRPEDRYASAAAALADLAGNGAPGHRATAVTWAATPGYAQRRWLWPIAVAFGIALVVAGWFTWSRPRSPAAPVEQAIARSIPPLSRGKYLAILPFAQAAGGHSFLAQGIADSLAARLFAAPGVHVVSRADLRGVAAQPWPAVARAVGANLVVHGDLEQAQGQLRVIVDMDNARTGARVWSQQFSGAAGDLFTLEDNIYAGLAGALRLQPAQSAASVAAAHPTENLAAYDLYLQAGQILRHGQTAVQVRRAVQLFTQAAGHDPSFALAYAGLANADLIRYRQTSQSLFAARAVAAAQTAARLGPNQPQALFALGNVWRATGKTAAAVAQLRRALRLSPNSDDGYRMLGAAYLAGGQAAPALAAYQHAVAVNRYFWLNHLVLGNAQFELGHYSAALSQYQRVNQLAPNNALGYLNAGAAFLGEGRYAASLAPLEQALRLHPSESAYSNLGFAHFYLHQYAASLPLFQKAVVLRPQSEEALGNLADAYRWTGQQALAHATYQRAIARVYQHLQVNPRDADALGSLALYDAKDGHPNRAGTEIRRARDIDPSDLDLVYIQAVVDAIGHHPRTALAALRQALAQGYSAVEARQDPELTPLHSQPVFRQLLARYAHS